MRGIFHQGSTLAIGPDQIRERSGSITGSGGGNLVRSSRQLVKGDDACRCELCCCIGAEERDGDVSDEHGREAPKRVARECATSQF